MKKINEMVVVKRKFKDGSIRPLGKHITETRTGEILYCPECGEVVKDYRLNKPPHYEHHSIEGRQCSFKTKNK
jgi:uncharacterized C2H2 Zn-finger protein